VGALGVSLLTGLGVVLAAAAARSDDDAEAGRRVRFAVESARQVENDWIRAVVGVTAEDADPAALADGVNRSMAWALEQARAEPAVEARSGSYHTHPVHEQGRLRRWRATQTLILEGGDAAAMTRLVGTLQQRLQLQSFGFEVSEATRAKVEEQLVGEVLAAFRARAERVREALGAGGYAIDEISLGASGGAPPPILRGRMEAGVMAAGAPPAVEGGSSRVVVTASGAIVLE
jgi:predicted secreted protein